MTNPSSKNQTNKPKITAKTPPVKPLTTTMKKKESNPMKVFVPVAITVGLILLSAIGYLMYNNSAQERALMAKVSELEEAENIRVELEDQYNTALNDLEGMRGENEELNALIDQQQGELDEQRAKIAKLIRDGKKDKNKRNAAREELASLQTQVAAYKSEIEEMRLQIEQLAMQNDSLQMNNLNLQTDLQTQVSANEQLEEARAVLVSEKEDLSKTVHFASVVKVKNIDVNGFKVKGNGKPVKRKVAKVVNQLKVCFTTTVNEVANPGVEKFFIRLVNPIGETMAIEELGSGTIVNKKTEEEIRYTHVEEYEYSNDETQLCFMWEPQVALQKGNYNVEIYNKGYLCGTGEFFLK